MIDKIKINNNKANELTTTLPIMPVCIFITHSLLKNYLDYLKRICLS